MKNRELSIGIFVFVALILLAAMIIGFRDSQYIGKQYHISAVFNYVTGVVVGAPVRYAGVDVGRVAKADVYETEDGETKVRLTLAINYEVKIKNDSPALISSLGIIGEKYVEISPGTKGAPKIEAGGELVGVDPIAIETVMANAQRAMKKLEDAFTAVNNILTEDTQKNVQAAVVNFKNFSGDMDALTKKIEVVVDKINKGEGTLGKLIYAQDLHDELLALIKGIREHGIFYKSKDTADVIKKEGTASSKQSFGTRK